jgi:hypothetical protein
VARKQIVTVEMVDDLDGGKADETIAFGFEGKSYEIDLSKRNASAFRKLLTPYVDSARKPSARRTTRGRSGATADPKAIRAWALASGISVPARGRIPSSVLEQYRTAK